MNRNLLPLLLAALLGAAAAVMVDRGLHAGPDAVDARIEALEAQLARSAAVRDALDAALAHKQERLRRLAAREDSLKQVLARLEASARRQHQTLMTLRAQTARSHERPPDTLHRDLNHILHLLPARAGADPRRP